MDRLGITGAAMITQFFVLALMFVAAFLLRTVQRRQSDVLPWVLLVLALGSLGLIFFSDPFTPVWVPAFGGSDLGGLSWGATMSMVFGLDVLILTLVIARSGGARMSPFTPVLLLVPVIAIFLEEPTGRVLAYALLVAIGFTITSLPLWFISHSQEGDGSHGAYWLVSLATLTFAAFIGLVTRT